MTKLFSTLNELQSNLLLLSEKLGIYYSKLDWAALIDRSLQENNLEVNEPVPKWLVYFIRHLVEAKEVEAISFERPIDQTNSERRWLGFVNSVVGGEWEYDGESESIAFDSIGVQGIIDHISKNYYLITC